MYRELSVLKDNCRNLSKLYYLMFVPQVSATSSPQKTICLCNHLTWFGGGLLVAPNTFNVERELLKLKNIHEYPALLATVCTIVALYVLVLIWARKRDKRDAQKVFEGVFLFSYSCTHSHILMWI